MLSVQSYLRPMMRIQEERPALTGYQSLTECPLRNQEMNSSWLCRKLPMLLLLSR